MNWEDNVRKVVPYVPGEQPKCSDIIKLNTNECPYPPAPGVERLKNEMEYGDLRLYPKTMSDELTKALADYYQIKTSEVFVGVGSDDVISLAFLTFFNSKLPILFPDITYSFYDVWAELYKIPYSRPALDENFRIRKEDYCKENGGIIFPNPNAPTGIFEDPSLVEEIIAANQDSIVIIDEAYIDFGGTSVLPLIHKYDNLLVIQTFSKSRAMAGLRIGFAMGNEKLIQYMNDVKFSINSYTMNLPAQVLGVEAVKDKTYFKEIVAKMVRTREWMKSELKALGFTFPDSMSNFVFATHSQKSAKEIFEYLKTRKIFVRYFDLPRIDNYLRISVGTDEEAKALIDALQEYIK
ncbi:MAG TPA: histidinol-phosphate transaminase [Lachnospiraceae bacterium]|nr:histidinol-phosphate transaminase [Lachnospiraceae bacterium]HPF28537.1 histidinol-phosphate transaminase [Lachnospiraceae bacterium]